MSQKAAGTLHHVIPTTLGISIHSNSFVAQTVRRSNNSKALLFSILHIEGVDESDYPTRHEAKTEGSALCVQATAGATSP
jgi:hypothetical protein